MDPELGVNLAERLAGPFNLRLLIQPTVGVLLGLRDGRRDAAQNAIPFLQALFGAAHARKRSIASAWASLSKVMVMAFLLDSAFQFATLGNIRFLESVLVAFILCALPYSLLRGPIARLIKRRP